MRSEAGSRPAGVLSLPTHPSVFSHMAVEKGLSWLFRLGGGSPSRGRTSAERWVRRRSSTAGRESSVCWLSPRRGGRGMAGRPHRNKIAADHVLAAAVSRRQELFRAVNDQIERLGSTFAPESSWLILVCECGDEACREHVELPRDVYDDVREDPLRFVIK